MAGYEGNRDPRSGDASAVAVLGLKHDIFAGCSLPGNFHWEVTTAEFSNGVSPNKQKSTPGNLGRG